MTYITLDFGNVNRVQDLGVVMNAEGPDHLPLVLLVLLLIFNLQRGAQGDELMD